MKQREQTARHDPRLRVVGAQRAPFRDLYLRFLWMRWDQALLAIGGGILAINFVFALVYLAVGGVHGMAPTLLDAFFFSVQTLATIGYGAMYPVTVSAHAVVAFEALCGLLVAALVTGMVFAKFTLSTARIAFSRQATIGPMDGTPTLMFRIGHQRDNSVIEAQIRVALTRTAQTLEGETFYRMVDLKLDRERSPRLARSWTVLHQITADSPLHGLGPDDFEQQEFEFVITLLGLDDTSLQPIHGTHTYLSNDVLWGMRPADMLCERTGGKLVLDVRRFHDVQATPPQPDFPYSGGYKA